MLDVWTVIVVGRRWFLAFSWLGRQPRDVRRRVRLCCVALARSASCHSTRSSQVVAEELVVPVGTATASVVVVFVSFREGGSSYARRLTSSRRRLLPHSTTCTSVLSCVRDWTVLFSFPLFSSKFGVYSFIVYLHYINDESVETAIKWSITSNGVVSHPSRVGRRF